MNAADFYHVGIVTDALEETREQLTAALGYEWPEEIGGSTQVCVFGVDMTMDLRIIYSRTTPRIELVRSVPGTLWEPATSGIHHLGYWTDDVVANSAALEQQGFPLEALGKTPDGDAMWAYHRSPVGPRIEIVSRLLEPVMNQYWS